MQGTILQI